MKILFANIGWMTHYRGNNARDQIKGGGSHRNEDKHEAFNFLPINGKCYGYVQPVKWRAINLNRIDQYNSTSEFVKDVLVVWIARHPVAGGTYIVGWYKNATVYRIFQDSKSALRNRYAYNIVAEEKNCTLVPNDKRIFLVPRANKDGHGFLGQANVWYADSTNTPVLRFRQKVVDYIQHYTTKGKKFSLNSLKVDSEARKRVEKAAIDFVTKEYKALGYKIKSREKDNIGWDLDAKKNGIYLKLEVKGMAKNYVNVVISNNEYKNMMANKDCYRLCVVINAVTSPSLINFIWDEGKKEWISDEDESIILSIEGASYIATVK